MQNGSQEVDRELPPGRPQRSTGAPPGSSPRAATRSGPVRPGPASGEPPARPGPGPARPKWAVQRGGGSEGRPRPRGADKRVAAVCLEARSAQDLAAAAHPVPLPEPRGQRLLIIVRAQRARRRGGRPSPSAALVDANPAPPTPDTLSGFGVQRGRPRRVGGDTLGFAEAAPPSGLFGEHAQSPPTLGGPYRLPSTVPSPIRAQASPERGSVLPNLPSESFAKREVIAREAAPGPPKVTGLPQIEKVRSGAAVCGRREFLHLRGPTTHSPSATCTAVPASSARLLLQSRYLLAADPPAPKPAPGYGLPAPARPGSVERGGAAEAAPPTPAGEWFAQHPLNSRPSTQPSCGSTVARDCSSGL
ncbi:PREDICTED: transcription initiation factor TFIID subunit 4-like [Lipotes vexillifer]|uniref:Transcription initiation factor TFIID subunit 4-like n=1 Tax=Lipotes vexillifer TaxID=118797 RepID=A0A340YDK6_LIPVE|nr:PREDICTED: transcription initiation factor TFIID subunit 4-like [Lipotes vexillifer]